MTGEYKVGRRTFIAGTAAVAASTVFGICNEASAEEMIRVATWGGSWRDSLDRVVGAKIRALGGAVDYVLDTPQGNLAKLVAARTGAVPFDNMESGLELVQLMAADRFIADLNYDLLPNAAALPQFARAPNYVMTLGSMDGIVYNHDAFKQLGLEAPQRYSDLANPALAGRVAFPDITHTQHWNAVTALAYEAGATEADLAAAIPLINKIKPSYFYSSSTEISTRMASGEIIAAPWHAGFVVRLRRDKVPLSITFSEINGKRGSFWPVLHHVVRNSEHSATAHAFLNAYLAPEAQLEHATKTGVLPTNPDALLGLAKDPENQDVLQLNENTFDNLFVVDFTKVKLNEWRSAWAREVVRG